ncbi:retrovirus-related pol polyprotein from transposon TNT 1-94 [Tanacetum coccineum]
MDSENYKEGQSMQRPPLFEANCFIYWKNRFETYVKSKDIDLWHIIVYGNYKPTIKNKDGKDEIIPYEKFKESHKKMISKNDEAKIALDESFSSRNHVRTFLRALPTKWRPKDSEISKVKKEKYKSLALKARKISSDEEVSCSESDDEEHAMAVRDFKKFFRRRGKDPNHFISDYPKHSYKDQKAFVVGCWSDREDDSKKEEICLMALENNEIKDSRCSRHMTGNKDLFSSYKAIDEEPKNVKEAIQDESWTMVMQEELNQFKTNDVWSLVPPPNNQTIIGTNGSLKKLDKNGVVSRNKARLVAQGYNQQEGIDFDETYALVARLETIRILLACACAHDFKNFQMDVKSAFLNGFINEEIFVAQPSGFVDFEKPNHVFKLKKALYGLKQAPKA